MQSLLCLRFSFSSVCKWLSGDRRWSHLHVIIFTTINTGNHHILFLDIWIVWNDPRHESRSVALRPKERLPNILANYRPINLLQPFLHVLICPAGNNHHRLWGWCLTTLALLGQISASLGPSIVSTSFPLPANSLTSFPIPAYSESQFIALFLHAFPTNHPPYNCIASSKEWCLF